MCEILVETGIRLVVTKKLKTCRGLDASLFLGQTNRILLPLHPIMNKTAGEKAEILWDLFKCCMMTKSKKKKRAILSHILNSRISRRVGFMISVTFYTWKLNQEMSFHHLESKGRRNIEGRLGQMGAT
jgi:hypothetical protein